MTAEVVLAAALRETLERLQPAERTARTVTAMLSSHRRGSPRRWRVLAAGKAAPAMMTGALRALGARVEAALVVCPDGTPADVATPVLRAAHPIPDERSLAAAAEALRFARGPGDGVLLLLSGGASALLAAPRGLSLEQKAQLTRALQARGAPITAMNAIRRRLSWIKGGGLLRAAAPRPMPTVALRDVLGGAPWDVASGPGLPDPTSDPAARAALEAYAPEHRSLRLYTPCLPLSPAARRARYHEVAGPEDAAAMLATVLRRRGARVELGAPSTAHVEALAAEYQERAARLGVGEAWVRCAEPTLAVPAAAGRGGRSTHLALLVASRLPPGVAFLAGATDGADGSSGTAGAVVTRDTALAGANEALAAYDTAPYLDARGATLRLGPTGINLADVHAVYRAS